MKPFSSKRSAASVTVPGARSSPELPGGVLQQILSFLPPQHGFQARAAGRHVRSLLEAQSDTLEGLRGILRDMMAVGMDFILFHPQPNHEEWPAEMAKSAERHFAWSPGAKVVAFAPHGSMALSDIQRIAGGARTNVAKTRIHTEADVEASLARCMWGVHLCIAMADLGSDFLEALAYPGAAQLWFACYFAMRRLVRYYSFTHVRIEVPSVSAGFINMLLWEKKASVEGRLRMHSPFFHGSVDLETLRSVLEEMQEAGPAVVLFSPEENPSMASLAAALFDWDPRLGESVVPLGRYSKKALSRLRKLGRGWVASTMHNGQDLTVQHISEIDDITLFLREVEEIDVLDHHDTDWTLFSRCYWVMRCLLGRYSFKHVYVEHSSKYGRDHTQIKALLWESNDDREGENASDAQREKDYSESNEEDDNASDDQSEKDDSESNDEDDHVSDNQSEKDSEQGLDVVEKSNVKDIDARSCSWCNKRFATEQDRHAHERTRMQQVLSGGNSRREELQAAIYSQMGRSSPPRHGETRFECSCGFTEEQYHKALVEHLASFPTCDTEEGARRWFTSAVSTVTVASNQAKTSQQQQQQHQSASAAAAAAAASAAVSVFADEAAGFKQVRQNSLSSVSSHLAQKRSAHTRLCKNHLAGYCKFGEACHFSHLRTLFCTSVGSQCQTHDPDAGDGTPAQAFSPDEYVPVPDSGLVQWPLPPVSHALNPQAAIFHPSVGRLDAPTIAGLWNAAATGQTPAAAPKPELYSQALPDVLASASCSSPSSAVEEPVATEKGWQVPTSTGLRNAAERRAFEAFELSAAPRFLSASRHPHQAAVRETVEHSPALSDVLPADGHWAQTPGLRRCSALTPPWRLMKPRWLNTDGRRQPQFSWLAEADQGRPTEPRASAR